MHVNAQKQNGTIHCEIYREADLLSTFVKGVFSVIGRCFFMIPLVDNRFSGPSPVVVVVGHGRGRFHQVPRRPWSSPVVVGRGRGRRQSISPGGPSPVVVLGDRRWAL